MANNLTDNPGNILEAFHIKFIMEKDPSLKIEELYSFVSVYSTSLMQGLSEKGHDLLCKIIIQLPDLFETFVKSSFADVGEKNEYIKKKTEDLQTATLCLKIFQLIVKDSKIPHSLISLLHVALNILFQAYTHCKDSELIYGELLENFTDQLGCFFKSIETLKSATVSELQHLCTMPNLDADVTKISVNLGKLCELVTNFDATRAFDLWKVYIRFLIAHRESLKHNVDVDSVLTFLSSNSIDIMKHYKLNLCEPDNQDEELYVKIAYFQINIIMKILEYFYDCINESIQHLKILILSLYDLLILCYSPLVLQKNSLKFMKNTILKSIPSIILHLSLSKLFSKSVLQLQSKAITSDQHTALFLLKLCALPVSEEADIELKKNYFKDMLSTLQANNPEDDLNFTSVLLPKTTLRKLVALKNDEEETITIYEHAVVELSAYLKLFPDAHIQDIEHAFLQYFISTSDIASLLISDAWIYRMRCSSPEFLKAQCCLISEAYVKSNEKFQLENLLRRMLKFLPSSYKGELLLQYEGLNAVINKKHKIFSLSNFMPSEVAAHSDVSEQINHLMAELCENISDDIPDLVQRASNCLELCSLFLNISGNAEILKFIEFAKYIFKSEVYEIQMAVLAFIKTIPRNLPSDPKLEAVMVRLADLLAETLQSQNFLVRCDAFNAFHKLAMTTNHPRIISETIKQAPILKPAINAFINKVPLAGFLSEKDEMQNLRKQISKSNEVPQSTQLKINNSVLLSLSSKNNSILK